MAIFSVGIIGAGSIVTSFHLPVLLAMQQVRVEWITDIDPTTARSVAKAFGVPTLAMPDPLSEIPRTDIVVLAIPYGARPPYYEALRGRETAIYVEKPIARTAGEHLELCSWFADYQLASGLQRRCFGHTQLARQVVQDRLFGRLRSMRFGLGHRGAIRSGTFMSDPKLTGGGRLIEEGIHGVDALMFLSDATSAHVRRATMILDHEFDLHTDADIEVQTADGTTVDVQVTVSYLQDTIECIECIFENGTISFSLYTTEDIKVQPAVAGCRYALLPAGIQYPKTSLATGHENWTRFIAGLSQRQANWTSAISSLLTTKLIEDIYCAGRAVQPQTSASTG
jgi:predicted dehydrogenase